MEKDTAQTHTPEVVPSHGEGNVDYRTDSPPVAIDQSGWKYKHRRFLGATFWYASPRVQLTMVSFVCFLCPGMFNALGGLGGGGKADPTLADNMVSHSSGLRSGLESNVHRSLRQWISQSKVQIVRGHEFITNMRTPRTPLFILPLQCLLSSVALSLTNWALRFVWLLVVLDIVSMQFLSSHLFTQMLVASISLLVHFLEFVLVFYGLLKELSWFHIHMKVIKANTSVFFGLSSILVLFLVLWYVMIDFSRLCWKL